MKSITAWLRLSSLLLLGSLANNAASAATFTHSGSFTDDTSSYVYSFTSTSTQSYVFSTSSYATGGFVPVLTLFSAAGRNLGTDGGDGPCVTLATCHDDASLTQTLTSGSYLLYLTELPNGASPTGNLSAGFLFGLDPNSLDPTITGDLCNVSGGMFLQTDLSVCAQRTANYTLNVTNSAVAATVTPEPAGWTLVLLPGVFLLGFARRTIA